MNSPNHQTPEFPEANVIHIDALPQGTLLGEFEILGLLGVGGFGMVYGAYDHSLHRTVAIKEYMPSALASRVVGTALSVRSSVDQSTYAAGLTSFVAEARLLAQFDHPSLVKVYRFWEANNTAYMAMPLYQGMTLKQARSQMSCPPSKPGCARSCGRFWARCACSTTTTCCIETSRRTTSSCRTSARQCCLTWVLPAGRCWMQPRSTRRC